MYVPSRNLAAQLLVVVSAGCGRLGFDVESQTSDASTSKDAPVSDGTAGVPVHVQATNATIGGSTTLDATFTTVVASGDTIAVAVSWDGPATLVGVTDSMNNTYVLVGSTLTGLGSNARTAYASNITGGTITVTAQLSASSTGVSLLADDVAGASGAGTLVSANSQFQPADPAADALSSGPLVLSGGSNYVFGASFDVTGNDATFTPGTGFAITTSGARGSAPFMAEYAIEVEPVTFTENLSVGDYMTLAMAFKPAS